MQLAQRAAEIDWYHTIELAPGLETEGVFDLRPYLHRYGLPERMDGMRALEVGTFDGFWAFEMERRGAAVTRSTFATTATSTIRRAAGPRPSPSAPRGPGSRSRAEAFGSNVERREISVYEATPEELGTFDLVFCGSVIIHLRDQVLALERIAALCDDVFVSVEAYAKGLSLLPFAAARYRALREASYVFWEPNLRAWREMLLSAGFRTVEQGERFDVVARAGWKVPHVVQQARK